MRDILYTVNIQVNPNIYLKDPESSELGKKIIRNSIELMYDHGFELFTFKKLSVAIESTEASIYRYFENKHKLLLYLTSWYWAWTEYRLVFSLANITSPEERLTRAVKLLTENVEIDGSFAHINESKLTKIVNYESSKAYLVNDVDEVNKFGVFAEYKQVVERVSQIILEINPNYKYPNMLVSTVIEGAHHERFFADHLPRLTNVIKGEDAISEFYKDLVFKAIQSK